MKYFSEKANNEYQKQIRILKGDRQYPVYECLINPSWKSLGQARILISREMSKTNLISGVYLVDLYCLGLKDTFCNVNVPKYDYEKELKLQVFLGEFPQQCHLDFAHNIIYGAIQYAEKLGFSPEKDFKLSQHVLEPKEAISLRKDIVFGSEGQPLYIPGPYDDSNRIIQTLRKTVGDGNFSVMCEDGDILTDIDEMEKNGFLSKKKIGRNSLCPCGSGKKFKKCCGSSI